MITQKSDSIYIKLKQVKTEKNILREHKHTAVLQAYRHAEHKL